MHVTRRDATEHQVGIGLAFADRRRRELHAVGHIADGMDVRHACAAVDVDAHGAAGIERDTGGLEAQATGVGAAPESAQHGVGKRACAVVEPDGQTLCAALDGAKAGTGDEANALPCKLRLQQIAHVVVEPAQDLVAAQHQRDFGAEAAEQAGELERDVARTLHHHPARLRGPEEQLVRSWLRARRRGCRAAIDG